MATIKSVYKRYNGSSFDIIYFKTSYDQVGVDATTRFLKPSTHTVNGKSFYDSGDVGITLYAGDIKLSSSDNTTISSKLSSIQTAINGLQTQDADLTAIAGLTGTSGFLKKTAANTWALDTTVLTSGNYSTTLGSVYQGKNDNLTSLAGLSTSSTGLVKFTNGTASIDTTSYATTSAIANMVTAGSNLTSNKLVYGNGSKGLTASSISYSDVVTASSNFTTDKIIVANGNNKTLKTSTYSVTDLVNLANGASEAWATTLYDGSKIVFGKSAGSASENVSSLSNTTTVTIASSTETVSVPSGYTYLYCLDDSGLALKSSRFSIKIEDLQVGDVFYITDTDVPDFWWDGGSFQKLETTKVEIDDFVTNSQLGTELSAYSTKASTVSTVTYDSTNHIIKKTINGSETDVVDLDNFASLNNSTGAISIGGVSKTPLYSHQTMKYRAIKVAGTQQIADTSNTALNFLNGGNVAFTWDSTNTGVKASVDLSGYVPTTRTVNGHALSSNVTVTRSDVDANKIYYGPSSGAGAITPTGMITNDIWIDTSNAV